jgi:hypothetical protein
MALFFASYLNNRFSAWLDSTFDLKNTPGCIIDIAGGQGKLSLTLTFKVFFLLSEVKE